MRIRKHHLVFLAICFTATVSSSLLVTAKAEAAPTWTIGPKAELPAELSAKAEKALVLTTKIAGISVEYSCTGISLDKTLIEAEGKGTGTALFSGCITRLNGATSTPCEPKVGTEKGKIASKALKGQLVLHEGTTTLAKVTAVEGETLTTIESGAECPIGAKVPVIGTLYLKDAGGEFEVSKEAHLLETGPLTTLWTISKTAEHVATTSGSAGFSLAGEHLHQPWSGSGSKSIWTIGPKAELPAELSAKAEKALVLTTKIAGISVEYSCTGISLDKTLIEAEGKGTGTALFSGCITRLNGATSTPCEPKVGTEKGKIASKALKGQLVLHEGTTTLAKVTAVEGETLTTIESGAECPIGAKVPVIGTLYLKDAGGEFEVSKEAHLLETGPLTTLWTISKTAEHVATTSGSAGFSLAGEHLHQPWSGSGSKSIWTIGPKAELPAELSAKAEKALVLTTKIAGISVEYSCTGISLDKTLIEAEGKGTGTALFSGCITRLNGATSTPCEPKVGTEKGKIASKALKGQLVLHEGTTTLAKVTAVEGETLTTIESGAECPIGAKVPVIGTLYLKDAGGEFEVSKEAHLLETGPLTTLWTISKTAEHVATTSGSAGFSLAGEHLHQPWSGSGS